jgi:hypothetical protein
LRRGNCGGGGGGGGGGCGGGGCRGARWKFGLVGCHSQRLERKDRFGVEALELVPGIETERLASPVVAV